MHLLHCPSSLHLFFIMSQFQNPVKSVDFLAENHNHHHLWSLKKNKGHFAGRQGEQGASEGLLQHILDCVVQHYSFQAGCCLNSCHFTHRLVPLIGISPCHYSLGTYIHMDMHSLTHTHQEQRAQNCEAHSLLLGRNIDFTSSEINKWQLLETKLCSSLFSV